MNGNVVTLTRTGKHRHEQTTAYFTYDNNGQILSRRDKPLALDAEHFFAGTNYDPELNYGLDSYGQQVNDSEFAQNAASVSSGVTVLTITQD